MKYARLTQLAKRQIDKRGGTPALKRDAERLKTIARGPGTPQEKAKRAAEALKRPGGGAGGQPGPAR